MKKFIIACLLIFGCCPLFSQWGYGYGCHYNSGLYNAAAITSIVANSVSILSNITTPRTTIVTTPAYSTSVYSIPTIVTPAPVVVTPAPVVVPAYGPYYRPCPPSPPPPPPPYRPGCCRW